MLKDLGCVEVRQKGSHIIVRCGVCTSVVPAHAGEDLKVGDLEGHRTAVGALSRKGMDGAMSTYTVRYERDESGWWVAQVKESPAAITQGRTIAEARRRIREALALALDDDAKAEKAKLIDDVKLPADVRRALVRAQVARKRLEADAAIAQASTTAAIAKLVKKLGLSVRDAGELLGISYQRVQQLAPHAPK